MRARVSVLVGEGSMLWMDPYVLHAQAEERSLASSLMLPF
jgi:hypothetical protein